MLELPREFTERMREQLGDSFPAFIASYQTEPQKAIRVNTLKISVENFKKISPFALLPTPWEPSGFFVEGEGLGKTVLHAAGAYYVQEPSAMSAVPELEAKAGERVLDLCSAPGGKGTQIAQYMNGEGILVLNEPVQSRRDILMQNVERLGIKNATVTCADPDFLAKIFENYFDKILVDAPCSGEGMFKKEPNAIPEWSPQNVKMCAERQAKILAAADKMLCGGGRLVYSTCTFSTEEDEGQIENFLKSHTNYKLIKIKKLLPHEVRGEGHFVAVLEKSDGERADDFPPLKPSIPKKSDIQAYREWESATLNTRLENIILKDNMLYCFNDGAQNFMSSMILQDNRRRYESFRFSQAIPLGKIESNRFTPAHAISTRLTPAEANAIEVDEKTAISYLRGLTFECPQNLKGWNLVTYKNLPLGWCKAVNGTAKNHLPKGLRI